jgi:hypothetical protein
MLRTLAGGIGTTNIRVADLFSGAVCDATVLWRPQGSLVAVAGTGSCAVALWELPELAGASSVPVPDTPMRLLVKLPPAAVGGGVRRVVLETMASTVRGSAGAGTGPQGASLLVVLGNDACVRVWAVVEAGGGDKAPVLHGTWSHAGVVDICLCPVDPGRPTDTGDVCVWLAVVVDRAQAAAPAGDRATSGLALGTLKVALRRSPGGGAPAAAPFTLHFVTEGLHEVPGGSLAPWPALARQPTPGRPGRQSMRMVAAGGAARQWLYLVTGTAGADGTTALVLSCLRPAVAVDQLEALVAAGDLTGAREWARDNGVGEADVLRAQVSVQARALSVAAAVADAAAPAPRLFLPTQYAEWDTGSASGSAGSVGGDGGHAAEMAAVEALVASLQALLASSGDVVFVAGTCLQALPRYGDAVLRLLQLALDACEGLMRDMGIDLDDNDEGADAAAAAAAAGRTMSGLLSLGAGVGGRATAPSGFATSLLQQRAQAESMRAQAQAAEVKAAHVACCDAIRRWTTFDLLQPVDRADGPVAVSGAAQPFSVQDWQLLRSHDAVAVTGALLTAGRVREGVLFWLRHGRPEEASGAIPLLQLIPPSTPLATYLPWLQACVVPALQPPARAELWAWGDAHVRAMEDGAASAEDALTLALALMAAGPLARVRGADGANTGGGGDSDGTGMHRPGPGPTVGAGLLHIRTPAQLQRDVLSGVTAAASLVGGGGNGGGGGGGTGDRGGPHVPAVDPEDLAHGAAPGLPRLCVLLQEQVRGMRV